MRWDDSQDPDLKNQSISMKKLTFHLLISASKPSLELCKTLLSASIPKYPPPTLIGYVVGEDRDRPGADVVRKMLQFLDGDSAHDEDLVLVVDQDTLFQLPAEVLVNRFVRSTLSSTSSLLEKFGPMPGNFTTFPFQRKQRYYTNVLSAAQKICPSPRSSVGCSVAPQPPLPKGRQDPYRSYESQGSRPRYINSAMMMGAVSHLRPIYNHADKLTEHHGRNSTQHIFSQVFGVQEYHREAYYQSTLSSLTQLPQRIASKLFSNHLPHPLLDHSSTLSNSTTPGSSEFGIGLDYTSRIFQIIDLSSRNDIHSVKFSNLSESLNMPRKRLSITHLPQDLNLTAPPFALHYLSNKPFADLNALPQHLTWSDIPLLASTFVPTSPIVPSALKISLNDSLPLWYETNAGTLLHQSLRSLLSSIAVASLLSIPPPRSAKFQAELVQSAQEMQYIDLRGGRGGVWTDKGEWLSWNEVCGSFDEAVFADGKGAFVIEDGD